MSNLAANATDRRPRNRPARGATHPGTLAYGLIAVCISLALITVLHGIGERLNSPFTAVSESVD